MNHKIDIIITRHANLVALLIERGLVDEGTRVIQHATNEDVTNKHVLGVIPHHMSVRCASITELPIGITREEREAGTELSLARLRQIAGQPVTYVVTKAVDYEHRLGRCVAMALKATDDGR